MPEQLFELGNSESWFLKKPKRESWKLPRTLRWESTRRHPYYLRFWKEAHDFSANSASNAETLEKGILAKLVLQDIGIFHEYPSPDQSCEMLGYDKVPNIWRDGSVYPLSCFHLLQILAKELSKEECNFASRIFSYRAFSESEPEVIHAFIAHYLDAKRPDSLHRCPDRAMIGLNIFAPTESILKASEKVVKHIKNEQDIKGTRLNEKKINKYFAVWDMHEGWNGADYAIESEKSFRQVSREMKLSEVTVKNHYKAAFELIVGQPFGQEVWFKLFGIYKLKKTFNQDLISTRYRIQNRKSPRIAKTVPEALINFNLDGTLDANRPHHLYVPSDEIVMHDFIIDVKDLHSKGYPFNVIAEKLECSSDCVKKMIEYISSKHDASDE